MAAIVQKGTTLKIGYGSLAYTGFVPRDWTHTPTGEQKEIKGTDNQTMTVLVENLGDQHSGSLLILDASGSITPPAKGSTVTLTPPGGTSTNYRCVDSSVTFGPEEAILNLTIIKEASMTYS